MNHKPKDIDNASISGIDPDLKVEDSVDYFNLSDNVRLSRWKDSLSISGYGSTATKDIEHAVFSCPNIE